MIRDQFHVHIALVMAAVTSIVLMPANRSVHAADEVRRVESPLYFRLPSTKGDLVELFGDPSAKLTVVCFLGTECPLAKLYGPRLQTLADQFASSGVQFVAINSNLHDSMEECRKFVSQHGIKFPMLKDVGNKVADAYGATRTTEVFLLDHLFQIRYQGRVDDQYLPGLVKPEPRRNDLKLAIEQYLAAQTIEVPSTEPVGCIIGRVPQTKTETDLTFSRDVVPLLQKHCVECHQAGEIGPFALTDYDEVVGWGEMLVEVMDQGRMPPWHADPTVGKFSNSREMPEREKEIIRQWVAGGMPAGELNNVPATTEKRSEWQLEREPDQILSMNHRPFKVPAEGVVEYQYFVVDPGFKEDKWITGAEVVPGNRSVVHHCIVFVRPPDGSQFKGVGWLGGYVPGQQPMPMKDGYAQFIPAGSKLVFQMHYTPTGTPQEDLTRIGLLFGKPEEITHKVFTVIGINQNFEIPPNSSSFPVTGKVNWFPKDGELLGMTPHMHLRGKSFEVSYSHQDSSHKLLKVPQYDFNWQHFYVLDEPLPLSDVETIDFTATFDNSSRNPVNPDPSEHVSWGDQTWQEMAIVFFAVSQPLQSQAAGNSSKQVAVVDKASVDQRAQSYVDDFFDRHDANRDGRVVRAELPVALQSFGFRRFDSNRDDVILRDELLENARRQFRRR